jgi:beta-galactosidase
MKKIFLFSFFLLSCIASLFAQRKHTIFDDDWKFHFGNAADPAKDFNYSVAVIFKKTGEAAHTAIDPKMNDSGWRTLNLPHDWAV